MEEGMRGGGARGVGGTGSGRGRRGRGTITQYKAPSHWSRWRSGVVGNIGSNLVGIRSVEAREGSRDGGRVCPYQG